MKYIATLKHRGSLKGIINKMFTCEAEIRSYATHYNYAILAIKKITLGK